MKYNGHESWTAWNVSLWISNDEGLYRLAESAIEESENRDQAAEYMLDALREIHVYETPDGAKYSKHNIRLAMRDWH